MTRHSHLLVKFAYLSFGRYWVYFLGYVLDYSAPNFELHLDFRVCTYIKIYWVLLLHIGCTLIKINVSKVKKCYVYWHGNMFTLCETRKESNFWNNLNYINLFWDQSAFVNSIIMKQNGIHLLMCYPWLLWCCVSVYLGYPGKVMHIEWLKKQKFPVSQIRGLEIWDQGVGRKVEGRVCFRLLSCLLLVPGLWQHKVGLHLVLSLYMFPLFFLFHNTGDWGCWTQSLCAELNHSP